MMSYYQALTNDSLGARKFKAQTDKDDIKFDEEATRKKQKKIDSETLSIANAVVASKEVRRRAIEKKKDVEHEDDDDIIAIKEDIDNVIFGVQVSQIPSNKSTKVWSSRPDHWCAIVEHMISHTYESACKMYASELSHLKVESRKATLYRWKRDMIEGKVITVNKDRLPKYGVEVDEGLASDITASDMGANCFPFHIYEHNLIHSALLYTNMSLCAYKRAKCGNFRHITTGGKESSYCAFHIMKMSWHRLKEHLGLVIL